MFNFQKEVVINSLDKAALVSAGGDKLGNTSVPKIDTKVRFHDGGEYFAKYIVDNSVYLTKAVKGSPFELAIKVSSDFGDHVQILIELGLDNDYRGDYSSAVWYFRKPILVDVAIPSTPTDAAKVIYAALCKAIPTEYQFAKVSYSGTTVTIKGVDSYQKVRKVEIKSYTCKDRCEGSSEECVDIVNAPAQTLIEGNDYVTYTKNTVEFGTYDYVLHNLRLPTSANLRFTSPSAPEMPVKGMTYYQYSFAYCVPRVGFGGLSVAGQTNHSTTLHTFYVREDLTEDFEGLLEDLGVDIKEIALNGDYQITVLPDSFASSQDLKAAKDINTNAESIETNALAIENNAAADATLAQRVTALENA